jgi:hypothetical protein
VEPKPELGAADEVTAGAPEPKLTPGVEAGLAASAGAPKENGETAAAGEAAGAAEPKENEPGAAAGAALGAPNENVEGGFPSSAFMPKAGAKEGTGGVGALAPNENVDGAGAALPKLKESAGTGVVALAGTPNEKPELLVGAWEAAGVLLAASTGLEEPPNEKLGAGAGVGAAGGVEPKLKPEGVAATGGVSAVGFIAPKLKPEALEVERPGVSAGLDGAAPNEKVDDAEGRPGVEAGARPEVEEEGSPVVVFEGSPGVEVKGRPDGGTIGA